MKRFLSVCILTSVSMLASANDYVSVASHHSVHESIERLKNIVEKKGLTVFAVVDHAAGAKAAGLKQRDSELLIFGNPRAGTPLMNCNAKIGLVLPLKALAYQDKNGKVWMTYEKPAGMLAPFKIGDCAVGVQVKVNNALPKLVAAAAK